MLRRPRWRVAAPDPVEAVKFNLEQNAPSRRRCRASEFLNRKANLSLAQIRKLNNTCHIPAEILTRPSDIGR